MGHKKYMLVGDVEVPYEHPSQDSLNSLRPSDAYMHR